MSSSGANVVLNNWLLRPRRINWEITMGLSGRRKSNINGEFMTSLSYLDDQGEKWGDTYIKVVGQHYDDYAHWNSISYLLPIGGEHGLPNFVPRQFDKRRFKGAAPGVTGLIGEVLATVFFQQILNLGPYDIAHILDNHKAPDICLDIEPIIISDLFRTAHQNRSRYENNRIAQIIERCIWDQPLPVECKSRRNGGDRQIRSALLQLLAYWRKVPLMAGNGIYFQIDVEPLTRLRIHLLIPREEEIENIRLIVTGNVEDTGLPKLSAEPNFMEFMEKVGGRLLG